MNTIDITGDYVVKANKTLSFTDQPAFYFESSDGNPPPRLTNFGVVHVIGTQENVTIDGIETSGGSTNNGLIWNKAGATFTVAATGADASATGYYTGGAGEQLVNDGLFQVTAKGIAKGEESDDPRAVLTNNGHFFVSGDQAAVGANLNGGDFTNTGVFIVRGGVGAAIGVNFSSSDLGFDNSGRMIVTNSAANIETIGVLFFHLGSIDVTNSGLIKADYAIREVPGGEHSETIINNSGRLIGKVDLGAYRDILHNTGVILGDVTMGKGADIFDGAGGKVLHGAVYGDLGDDVLTGGKGADILFGDGVQESAHDGADLLSGGRGNDQLHGMGGADTLIGGAGADTLTGGTGKDVFVYTSVSDSATGHVDLITDLHNSDAIDLAAIDADTTQAGDQAFTLVGALDGHAGEAALRYDAASGLTSLSLDVDGDGVADAVVTMSGDHHDFTGLVL